MLLRSGLTPYHSKYFAADLTKRISSDSIEKLGTSVFNATVDLNPHQLDAALFAFRSPLSRGAILADEVGLGKTIEAGLVISQLWAERKRRILIITPMTLRKQWAQELSDKFFIQSVVLDTREYSNRSRSGSALEPNSEVVICSYHFARAKSAELRSVPWDLVVIDEAHRLRNVYKGNKIATAIKQAVSGRPIILLTATPLQNSLLELYGLVSFLDDHIFGTLEAFRARYMRGPMEERELADLRRRLQPLCQRTLRRQVQEYVRFTQRIPLTEDFTPTADEQKLYDQVSEYLTRDELFALPASQRQLVTLVLRKLLASSSFAIAGTLRALADRLTRENPDVESLIAEEYEVDDEADEEPQNPAQSEMQDVRGTDHLAREVTAEVRELLAYSDLGLSITQNAKGSALLSALSTGFKKLQELGAAKKAVIFTESRRTQQYLYDLLTAEGYGGRVLTINGVNTDDRSGDIYRNWRTRHAGEDIVTGNKSVDLRAALVEHFRDSADILIATEAASEGVNLQFCSLVVNYDLPWNPQRIEQRIGRCHRYGQKHDVVVINFLNRTNEADKRVFQLLDEKFQLFRGVFGSSDDILGALESGVDFEKRIAEIYQSCRTTKEIDTAFERLQSELELQIEARMKDTRAKLLENFDEEVASKLRVENDRILDNLDHIEKTLWRLTKFELEESADFDDEKCIFNLVSNTSEAPAGSYQLSKKNNKNTVAARTYRLNHPLAQKLISQAEQRTLPLAHVSFDYSGYDRKIGVIELLLGSSGTMLVSQFTVTALEQEDAILFAIIDKDGFLLDADIGEKLMRLPAKSADPIEDIPEDVAGTLKVQTRNLENRTISEIEARNSKFFDAELDKLDRWAEDLKHGLDYEIREIDAKIKQARREAPLAKDLREKLDIQRQIKELESIRMQKRKNLFEAQDEIDAQKDSLISAVEGRLQQTIIRKELFAISWSIV